MKAAEVVDILNTYPSASLIIALGDDKRSALLGWMPEETCRIKTVKISMQVADCIMRKYAHQFLVNTVKPSTIKKKSPTLITVESR